MSKAFSSRSGSFLVSDAAQWSACTHTRSTPSRAPNLSIASAGRAEALASIPASSEWLMPIDVTAPGTASRTLSSASRQT